MHWREFSACLQQKKVVRKAAHKYAHTITTTVNYDVLYRVCVCETLMLHFALITKRVFCARSCVSWLFLVRVFCVSIPTPVNDRVHIQIHVCMQALSGDPICEALISLIQQQHMDGGVEKEDGVRTRVDSGECLCFCRSFSSIHHTHSHRHTSLHLASWQCK